MELDSRLPKRTAKGRKMAKRLKIVGSQFSRYVGRERDSWAGVR